jgi:hypothetical protein
MLEIKKGLLNLLRKKCDGTKLQVLEVFAMEFFPYFESIT